MVFGGRNNIPSLSLNGFYDDCSNLSGRNDCFKEDIFQVTDSGDVTAIIHQIVGAAIAVTVSDMRHFGNQRSKVFDLDDFAASQREGSQCAAMKGANESNHMLTFGMIPCQFKGAFHRLRP